MTFEEVYAQLNAIGDRFAGYSVEYRTVCPQTWSGMWRVTIHASKNERVNYRVVCYGVTLAEAAQRVVEAITAIDRGN